MVHGSTVQPPGEVGLAADQSLAGGVAVRLMRGLRRISWRTLAALASGVCLALAFPPFEMASLAWVGLVPLLIALMGVTPRQGARLGWVAGLAFWLVGLSWMLRLMETSPAPVPLILLGCGLLVAYCAMFTAAFGLIFAWLAGRIGTDRLWQTLLLSVLATGVWVGIETWRGLLFGGFPWNALGVSQYRNLALIQCAEWGGVGAVSAVVVFMNAGFTFTVRRYLPGQRRPGYRPHIELFVGLLVTALCFRSGIGHVRRYAAMPPTLTVTAIQPAIAQLKKWEDGEAQRILTRLRSLTEPAMAATDKPDLVIWPETATPEVVTAEGESLELVRDLTRHGVPLLAGSMDVIDAGAEGFVCYNTAFLFNAEGHVSGRYDKRHLVPFGEYIPLSGVFHWLARLAPMGWNCTPGKAATVMEVGDPPIPFGCLICFEDILPALSRACVLNGARLLINQTNDAWFDRTGGPLQHMSHSVFRAVETRVPLIRVGNSGVTCLVQADGRVQDATVNTWRDPPQAAVVTWRVGVPGPEWKPTPYVRYGDRLFALPCGVVAGIGFVLAFAAARRKMQSGIPIGCP